MASPL
jgi:hypothetical protein